MRKSIKYYAFAIIFIVIPAVDAFADSDLEIIRKRVTDELMKPNVNEAQLKFLIDSINPDGSWPAINYADVSRTGFQHGNHLNNLVALSRAYKKTGSGLKGDARLRKTIDSSLDFWLKNDFICDNWWWNQIGTPDQLVKVLLIMDNDLTKTQVTKLLPIVGRANLSASGARPSGDRIKIAGILAKTTLFKRDEALFDEIVKVIAGEIKFETGRGMQYDYSFHHREDRVTSTLSYGLGYADAFAEWAELVTATKYKFPDAALNQLIDYYLDGICQTMVHGRYPDPGAENRSISRQGNLDAMSARTPEKLLKASAYRQAELEKIVKIRKGELEPDLEGSGFFWDSEYFSHQRPDYFTSVRMYSSRNHNMEVPYNSEGLMNHHYADGSNFISRVGDEYYDIFPVYDWQKIPGTTIVQKEALPSENEIQKKGLTEFVGAVTDGKYGAAAVDFKSPHDPLTAKKAWFFFDKEYVCLGTGVASDTNLPVVTTLNQCLLKGNVIALSGNLKVSLKRGDFKLRGVKWILHDNTAYIFPDTLTANLMNKTATGSWYRINHQSDSPKEEVSKEVFKLWIDHGRRPVNGGYQYIVLPSVTEKDLIESTGNRGIQILANNKDVQAVRHDVLKICQVVFYEPGEIEVFEGIRLNASAPGIFMIYTVGEKITRISVSDPSRKLRTVSFTLNKLIDKNGSGYSITSDRARGTSTVSLGLPRNEFAGKSVTIDLQ